MYKQILNMSLIVFCFGLAQVMRADYGETDEIIPNVDHEWTYAGSGNLGESVTPETLMSIRNASYIDVVISYMYDGKPVSQVVPAGGMIPLGLYGKIDKINQKPMVYRYNQSGKRYMGSWYNKPHYIEPTVYDQQFGGTVGGVLELSVLLSAVFNRPLGVRILVRSGYVFERSDISQIFPNVFLGYLSYIGFGSSMKTLANDPLEARHMLNLPSTFAQNRTREAALAMVDTALQTKIDAVSSAQWVAPSFASDVRDALNSAAQRVRDHLLAQGDSANLVEW